MYFFLDCSGAVDEQSGRPCSCSLADLAMAEESPAAEATAEDGALLSPLSSFIHTARLSRLSDQCLVYRETAPPLGRDARGQTTLPGRDSPTPWGVN